MDDVQVGALVEEMTSRGLTVATAESLTGGGLVARLVDVPGASHVVRGGACTYAVDTKCSVLGVSSDRLALTGPVDEQVARQMAEGTRRLFGASMGLSTTGVAGPGPADTPLEPFTLPARMNVGRSTDYSTWRAIELRCARVRLMRRLLYCVMCSTSLGTSGAIRL